MLFENYACSEAVLVAGMAEMVVNGVSTRKVEKVMEELCGTSFSKSTVSNLCKDLSKDVEAFQNSLTKATKRCLRVTPLLS
jgi:putative transposase